MTIKRERISGVDTAWLRMEHPTNLMMIVGVMMLDKRLNLRDVQRAVKSRFLAFRRFRCRLTDRCYSDLMPLCLTTFAQRASSDLMRAFPMRRLPS